MPENPASHRGNESSTGTAQPDATAKLSRGLNSDLERHLRKRLALDRERPARPGGDSGWPTPRSVVHDMTEDLEPD